MPTKRRRVSEDATAADAAVPEEQDPDDEVSDDETSDDAGAADDAGADGADEDDDSDDESDDSDESNDDDIVVKLVGSLDAEGLPHGRATVHFASGDVFRGRFEHGQRSGKGALEFEDGSIQTGTYTDDELEGEAVCEYPSGESMVAQYRAGVMEGAWETREPDGSVSMLGAMAGGQRVGQWTFTYPDGGILGGEVDEDGEVAGDGWTYSYPDGSVLHGSWAEGQMEKAYFVADSDPSSGPSVREVWYRYDPGTADRISATPRVRDPYEASRCEAKASPIGGSFGEGLFAKRPLAEGEVACFYAGTRVGHELVDTREWAENDNTLSIDDEVVIDVSVPRSTLSGASVFLCW